MKSIIYYDIDTTFFMHTCKKLMLILFIFFLTCTAGDPMNREDNNYVRSENELILPLIAIIKPMKYEDIQIEVLLLVNMQVS